MTRVLVAMSGGVDSSVAAARLLAEGYEVVGATLHLWDYPDDETVAGRCCAPEDVHDAGRVAAQLGIPHYSFDRRELFRERIVEPFVTAYLDGETPSPCVYCNRQIKIAELLRIARRLGADVVATGHYARIVEGAGGLELHRGRDASKDQSYFLHTYLGDDLKHLLFPLGDCTKAEIRAEAAKIGLFGAEKGESQELCFVPTGRYDAFVSAHADGRIRPGVIVDDSGKALGAHEGIHQFTVGQRRNIGVATGQRVYVTDIDRDSGRVTVGDRSKLFRKEAQVCDVVLAQDMALPAAVSCVIRYRGQNHQAVVEPSEDGVTVRFSAEVAAVVNGQFAVFYCGERVVGGGRIASSR
ncbi:MAG: tRNA 2-thiouridine(34) synthase MnmA [Polyangiaceae bacterium]